MNIKKRLDVSEQTKTEENEGMKDSDSGGRLVLWSMREMKVRVSL